MTTLDYLKLTLRMTREAMARPFRDAGPELQSECCGRPPLGDLDTYNAGRCSRCHEYVQFEEVDSHTP